MLTVVDIVAVVAYSVLCVNSFACAYATNILDGSACVEKTDEMLFVFVIIQ